MNKDTYILWKWCTVPQRHTIKVKQSTKNSLVNLMAVRCSQEKWKSNINQITKSCTDKTKSQQQTKQRRCREKKKKKRKKLWNTNFKCLSFNMVSWDDFYFMFSLVFCLSSRCDSKDKKATWKKRRQLTKQNVATHHYTFQWNIHYTHTHTHIVFDFGFI